VYKVLIFCDSDTSERLRFDDGHQEALPCILISDFMSSQRQNAVASIPHYVNPHTHTHTLS